MRGEVDSESRLLDAIAARTGSRPSRELRDATFEQLGLDSAAAVEIAGELAAWSGAEVSEELLFEQPTLGDLLDFLNDGADQQSRHRPRAPRRDAGPSAIVGMALRLPGADDIDGVWELGASDGDAIQVPASGRYDPDWDDALETLRGGYIGGVDEFDPLFFGLSPRDAAAMDPQHRLILELAWEAVERSGTTRETLRRSRTGVFVGVSGYDFALSRVERAGGSRGAGGLDRYTALGMASSMAAARVSHAFGLRGPSMTVDTACSSALVALHLAHRSLQAGDCELAIVGGVNLMLWPVTTVSLAEAGLLSAAARCRPFDRRADGFVRGEGAGVLVLEPADAAERRAERPLALLRGSAVNSDGRTNGILAPSPSSQRAVLEDAYADAGVAPGAVTYVEAQATGSPLGDSIEAKALGSVLAAERPLDRECALGSVKAKMGHLEAASGMAGLANVLGCARHEQVLPLYGFAEPNEAIPFGRLPVSVPTSPRPWKLDGPARFAGLSSSGFGGTNAHVVLEV